MKVNSLKQFAAPGMREVLRRASHKFGHVKAVWYFYGLLFLITALHITLVVLAIQALENFEMV